MKRKMQSATSDIEPPVSPPRPEIGAGVISVGVVEDSTGVRRQFQQLLGESPGFQCVCTCINGEAALRQIPKHQPDVVLMDIHLPGISGIECTARLKELLPELQIIMITVYEDTEKVFNALRAGACGYLLKRSNPDAILNAIRDAREGGAPMTSQIARKVVEAFQSPKSTQPALALTPRELEILDCISQGFADKEIVDKLSISFDTVRFHIKHIFEKLHVRSRTEAVATFFKPGNSNG